MISAPCPPREDFTELVKQAEARYAALPEIEKRRHDWDQRVSFVYGNLSLDNPSITKEMVLESVTKTYGPRP